MTQQNGEGGACFSSIFKTEMPKHFPNTYPIGNNQTENIKTTLLKNSLLCYYLHY